MLGRRARARRARRRMSSSTRSSSTRPASCPTRSRRSSAPSTCAADRRGAGPPRRRAQLSRTSCACAPASSAPRPDAVVEPADAAQVAAVIDACAHAGVAVVPFGGGTSVVGGVDPYAGRARAADRARPRPPARCRGRPHLADGDARPGLRGPEAEAALGAHGRDPRPLPAVVRVRDDRRVRRDPFGRAGIKRLRALRRARDRAGDGDAAGASCARWRRRTRPPGRRCAAGARLGGHARRDHRGDRARAPGAVEPSATRPGPPATSASACDTGARAGPERSPARRGPHLRRVRDADDSIALSGTSRRQSGRSLDAYLALRRRRGGCIVIVRLGGRPRVGRPQARTRASDPAPRGRAAGAVARAARGSTGASRAPTCATSSWTSATSSTRSRPRTPGRGCSELYTSVGTALERALGAGGTPGIVNCHLSHAYRDGASLYFTFVARRATGRGARPVARGQDGCLRGDRRLRRDDHPPPRDRAATTRRTWTPRSARWASRHCARSRSASTRPGS